MHDDVAKPVRRKDLEAVLDRRQPDPAGSSCEQPASPSGERGERGERGDGGDSVDPAVLTELRQLGEEQDFLLPLIDHYLEDTPRYLETIRTALARGDAEALARTAHELKGASGNLGIRHMCRMSDALQIQGKTGNLAAAKPLLLALEAEFQHVRRYLKNITDPLMK